MSEKKRGNDAQDHAQAPKTGPDRKPDDQKQDAPNYETSDQGQAIEVENMSSANDEGAS